MQIPRSVDWGPGQRTVRILDQRLLPERLVERELATVDEVVDAIRTLAVRGAPAIGVCAALGLYVSLLPLAGVPTEAFHARLRDAAEQIGAARPTAVNLRAATDRMLRAVSPSQSPAAALARLRDEGDAILREDREMCERIGTHGRPLLTNGVRVLTHCNAGALATAGIGTALAPIYVAARDGLAVHVTVCETRPLWQGARLTAWELQRAGIDVTLVTDAAAATKMRLGEIDLCLVGADRIARNGDVANKVGTYAHAVCARQHGLPFYVAAPVTTYDSECGSGAEMVIEERDESEITRTGERAIAPDGVHVWNPAFDVTPAAFITAIITDRGLHHPGDPIL